jgi:hypothetical protein
MRRNCFYSTFEFTFELTHQGGGLGRGDGKSICVNIVYPSSFKNEEKNVLPFYHYCGGLRVNHNYLLLSHIFFEIAIGR